MSDISTQEAYVLPKPPLVQRVFGSVMVSVILYLMIVFAIGWGAYTAAQLAKHPPLTGNYVNQGIGLFTNYSITDLSNAIFDLFWKWDDVLERFGVPESVANGLLFIPLLILVIGLVSIIRSGKTQPSDVYTLAFLALLLGYNWKMSRYLLPITPFLIAWFFAGLRSLRGYLKRAKNPSIRERDLVIPAFAAVWLAFLIPLDAYALFNRTGNGAHRGISAFANPLPTASTLSAAPVPSRFL